MAQQQSNRVEPCRYDAVLLDLDGTMMESAPGITASVKKALAEMQWGMPEGFDYTRFIGPPIFDSLVRFAHMPPEKAEACIRLYRKHYNGGEIFNNSPYPGMTDLLALLRRSGTKVCVATSKPQPMAEVLLKHFHLDVWLAYIAGADISDRESDKSILIRRCLEFCRIPPQRAVMVGDTWYDAAGAQKTGVDFIGALYGYGKKEEMQAYGAASFVNSVPELVPLLFPTGALGGSACLNGVYLSRGEENDGQNHI